MHKDYDLIYAVDVLEHLPDPIRFLEGIIESCRYLCVNLFKDDPNPWDGQDMHYPLRHEEIFDALQWRCQLIQVENAGDTVATAWKL